MTVNSGNMLFLFWAWALSEFGIPTIVAISYLKDDWGYLHLANLHGFGGDADHDIIDQIIERELGYWINRISRGFQKTWFVVVAAVIFPVCSSCFSSSSWSWSSSS